MRPIRIFILLQVLAGLIACQAPRATVPEELDGVWQTSAPMYATRPFEIRKDVLIFRTGEDPFDFVVYNIVKVDQTTEAGNTLFILTYIVPGGLEYKFSFFYTASHGGEIRFKHQRDMVWERKKREPSKDPERGVPQLSIRQFPAPIAVRSSPCALLPS
jgi:hypothetical protein